MSEVEEYTKRYANPILTIPDEIMGLGPVRNWVLDNFKENIVIMIDDDIDATYPPDQLKRLCAVVLTDVCLRIPEAMQSCIRFEKGQCRLRYDEEGRRREGHQWKEAT